MIAVVPFSGRAGGGGRTGTITLSRFAGDELVDVERWSGRDELALALEGPVWDRYAQFAGHPWIRGTVTWPGTPAAAARAGLSRSRYLQARDQLVRRGLVVVEDAATGRGRSSTVGLRFADDGPWSEREINAPLFEAALTYSHALVTAR
jgi:hypothetical protein